MPTPVNLLFFQSRVGYATGRSFLPPCGVIVSTSRSVARPQALKCTSSVTLLSKFLCLTALDIPHDVSSVLELCIVRVSRITHCPAFPIRRTVAREEQVTSFIFSDSSISSSKRNPATLLPILPLHSLTACRCVFLACSRYRSRREMVLSDNDPVIRTSDDL